MINPAPNDDRADDFGRMSFLEHLEELRKRLIYSCAGVAVGLVAAFAFIRPIFDFIITPLNALIAATTISAPWIMYQVWRFIAPGLYRHEKRFVIPFVVLTSAGFVAGAAFNHYIAFRHHPTRGIS